MVETRWLPRPENPAGRISTKIGPGADAGEDAGALRNRSRTGTKRPEGDGLDVAHLTDARDPHRAATAKSVGTRRPAPYRRAAFNAANTLKQPYHPTTAQNAIPIETKPLPTRAGQPVRPPVSVPRTSSATPRRPSRRRHAGIDQARHNAVQATATTAIIAPVVYRTMSAVTGRFWAPTDSGTYSGNARLVGMYTELYDHRNWLWEFVDQDNIQPTNNTAERALWHAVIG